MRHDDDVRLLVPRPTARRLSRRDFLGALGAGATLAACGTRGDAAGGSRTAGAPSGRVEPALNIYSWADYWDPDNQRDFVAAFGPRVSADYYDSNEAMIAKLELAKGTSGYDVIVPTNGFVPQLLAKGLLAELDPSKLPNLAHVEPAFLDPVWDRGNRYTVVKDWGSTGYVYDRRVITEELHDWAGFFAAARRPGVSGKVSVTGAPNAVTGMVFWRDGIDWGTEKREDLDHAERVLLAELAPHLKAFDSYPWTGMLDGSYVLSQAWSGDARRVIVEDSDRYRWVLGAPKTELWVDNWAILRTARHPEAAHAWINFMLDPRVSAREIAFHGQHTGVKGTRELLPPSTKALDLIYFTDAQRARMVPGRVTSAQDRVVAIVNKVKARASAS